MSARALSATRGTTSTTAAGNFPGQRLLLGYTKAVCVANDVMEELSLYISCFWEVGNDGDFREGIVPVSSFPAHSSFCLGLVPVYVVFI